MHTKVCPTCFVISQKSVYGCTGKWTHMCMCVWRRMCMILLSRTMRTCGLPLYELLHISIYIYVFFSAYTCWTNSRVNTDPALNVFFCDASLCITFTQAFTSIRVSDWWGRTFNNCETEHSLSQCLQAFAAWNFLDRMYFMHAPARTRSCLHTSLWGCMLSSKKDLSLSLSSHMHVYMPDAQAGLFRYFQIHHKYGFKKRPIWKDHWKQNVCSRIIAQQLGMDFHPACKHSV